MIWEMDLLDPKYDLPAPCTRREVSSQVLKDAWQSVQCIRAYKGGTMDGHNYNVAMQQLYNFGGFDCALPDRAPVPASLGCTTDKQTSQNLYIDEPAPPRTNSVHYKQESPAMARPSDPNIPGLLNHPDFIRSDAAKQAKELLDALTRTAGYPVVPGASMQYVNTAITEITEYLAPDRQVTIDRSEPGGQTTVTTRYTIPDRVRCENEAHYLRLLRDYAEWAQQELDQILQLRTDERRKNDHLTTRVSVLEREANDAKRQASNAEAQVSRLNTKNAEQNGTIRTLMNALEAEQRKAISSDLSSFPPDALTFAAEKICQERVRRAEAEEDPRISQYREVYLKLAALASGEATTTVVARKFVEMPD